MIRTSIATLMVTTTGALALVALLVLGLSGALPAPVTVGAAPGSAAVNAGSPGSVGPPAFGRGSGAGHDDGLSQTALDGDEVSPALATYGIDNDGNLFEVHSPDTEVPRLSGPTL